MCSHLLHYTPLPSVNQDVNELVHEEIRLQSPHFSQLPLPIVLVTLASITTVVTAFAVPSGLA